MGSHTPLFRDEDDEMGYKEGSRRRVEGGVTRHETGLMGRRG